jgi:uncharacterized protein HemY
LVALYRITGQERLYREYLLKVANRSDAPAESLAELGYYLLTKERFSDAAEAYSKALGLGLDSSHVQKIIDQYPQLGEYFKE